jgi:hypothetical protein
MNVTCRTSYRSTRIESPKGSTGVAVVIQAVRRLGINHDGIETHANTARFMTWRTPEFLRSVAARASLQKNQGERAEKRESQGCVQPSVSAC